MSYDDKLNIKNKKRNHFIIIIIALIKNPLIDISNRFIN